MDDADREAKQKLQALQVGYWSKRLDHTLTHTDTSSRLMYLVDGSVLALLYFSAQTFGVSPDGTLSRPLIGVLSAPTLMLAILNQLHVFLLRSQGLWYSRIDDRLLDLVDQSQVRERERRWFNRTHDIYRAVHQFVAICLLAAAVAMLLYATAYFEAIPVAKPSPR